jgi:rubrerythrin
MAEKLASLGMPEPHEDDEHVNYIRELIDNIIFTKDLDPAALAEKTSSPVEAIDLALGFEKDSVIFYIQFKKLVPEEEQFAVQGLVDEENHHINRLLVLKRAITSSSEDFYRSQPGIGDAEK